MRLVLAAIPCAKGDVEANLAQHLDVLPEAHAVGAQLVVFPEMSLSGSVDPITHPERAIPLDHDAVGRLVAATRRHQVAALFGIGEAAPDGPWITQVFAYDNHVEGVQRKRLLGDDEDGFARATDTHVFELGATHLGVVICAESAVDRTWDANAAGGATLQLLCAAPGLYGRRTDPEGWADGLAWWESAGLADARRHAQRLGVWVAIATQAGATVDEDFPGLAALVAPTGEVVARSPDERPATLVVDVPVAYEVEPVRRSVRVLVVDDAGRTLLAEFGDDRTGDRWWVPPGGGMEAGEDDLATARRELFEEVGRTDLEIGPLIGGRGGTFRHEDRWLSQRERWYLCRPTHFEVDPEVERGVRAEGIRSFRWWTAAELRAEGTLTGPRDLADLLDRILAGDLPGPEDDLGF